MMKKLRFVVLAVFCALVFLNTAIAQNRSFQIVPTVPLLLDSFQPSFGNGDRINLKAVGFPANTKIVLAYLLIKNRDGSEQYKPLKSDHLKIDRFGNLKGYVELQGIDSDDASAQLLLSTKGANVVATAPFAVNGDLPPNITTGVAAGSFSFTEASGDNVAQLNETLSIVTPNSGWTGNVIAVARQEYSTTDGTGAAVASVGLDVSGLSISAGQLSGTTNNGSTAYDATTKTMRLDVMDGSFVFALSTNFISTIDNVPPNVTAATATGLSTIRITLDEASSEVGGDAAGKFVLSGTGVGTAVPSSLTPVGAEPTTTWDLSLTGSLGDRSAQNVAIIYDRTQAGATLEDAAGNEVATTSSPVTVSDGIAPGTVTLRNAANSAALTTGEFLGSTTYTLRARVTGGNSDPSLSSVVFEGSDDGSSWTTLGTDASGTPNGSDTDFSISWNIASTGQFKILRARALDNAGTPNVSTSSNVGSATDDFNNNFKDTFRAVIKSVTPSSITASTGSDRAEILVEIQDNYGNARNTTGFNQLLRLSESTTATETWWDAASGGTSSSTQIDITINSAATSGKAWYSNSASGGPNTLVLEEPAGNFAANNGTVSANGKTVTVSTGTASQILVRWPGQTFVDGTGITGTATAQTTDGSISAELIVTDASNNKVTGFAGAKTIDFTTTATNAPDGTAPSVNGSTNLTGISVTFTSGSATVSVLFPKAASGSSAPTLTATDPDGTPVLSGVASSGVDVNPGALSQFAFSMTSPQQNGVAVTGTNTITAQDAHQNTVTSFDASADNVTITGSGSGAATITGLGSGSNNVLNQVADFSSGVANLTSLGMTITVTTTGAYTFTATSSTGKTGQATGISVTRVVTLSGANTSANALLDTTSSGADFTLSANISGTEDATVGDDFRIKWGFNNSGSGGSYGLTRQSTDLTPGTTIQYTVPAAQVKNLSTQYDYMFWWVENISTNSSKTSLDGTPTSSNPIRLILNPNLTTQGGVNGGDVAPASFTPGQNDQAIVSIKFSTNPTAATIQISTLTFDRSGSANTSDISSFHLYLDAGTLGSFDSGTDLLLKTVAFSGGTSVNFSNISGLNISGTNQHILVTVDVKAGATPSHTVGLNLNNPASITLLDNVFNGPASSINIDNFSNLGTTSDRSLPVEFSSFSANGQPGKIQLVWETASEINNEGFLLFRSDSRNGNYELLTRPLIPGHGNSNTSNRYEFVDDNVTEGNTYYYKLFSQDFNGDRFQYPDIVSATPLSLPKAFRIDQNYPNPFNPTTRFRFTIPRAARASLIIYNILGQKVRTIFNNRQFEPGEYTQFSWDARDDFGNAVANGIYYYVFRIPDSNFKQVRKMVFLK